MRRLTTSFFFLVVGFTAMAQTRITWQTLADVEFTDKYSEVVDAFYYYPDFGPQVKALAGKKVYIRGHMLTVAEEKGIYILSRNPFAACFFCGNAGPESIIELKMQPGHPKFKMDQIVTIQGVLRLNQDDLNTCNYLLEDAEVYPGEYE